MKSESSTHSSSCVIGKVYVHVHADAEVGDTTIALRTFVLANSKEGDTTCMHYHASHICEQSKEGF